MGSSAMFDGCSAESPITGPGEPTLESDELGSTEQAIVGGCNMAHVGAPCDPDGAAGALGECEGVCVRLAATQVACRPITEQGLTNMDGRVCGAQAGAVSNCGLVCEGRFCTAKNAPNGAACRPSATAGQTMCDGQCTNGVCVEKTAKCAIDRPGAVVTDCKFDFCAATNSSTCTSTPVAAGSTCTDGNACTRTDRCDSAGNCVGSNPVTCTSTNDPCLQNQCNPATGGCVAQFTTAACSLPNDLCHAGQCANGTCTTGAAVDCNDSNPCTVDSCNPSVGCVRAPKCPASTNLCVVATCNAVTGACGTAPVDCDDGLPCTFDSCQPQFGCLHAPIPGCGFDGGVVDTGTPFDTGFASDTAVGFDTGGPDTTPQIDTGRLDTGRVDTGVRDTGVRDTGQPFDTFFEEDTDFPFDTGDFPDSDVEEDAATDGAPNGEGGLQLEEDLSRGGCGCRTTGTATSPASALSAMALGLAIAARRRRR